MATGEIVLGSFLGSFFHVLFDKLASHALGYAQPKGISTALLDWKEMLVTINAVLADAEDKQLSGNPLVKLWLDDVRDLAYDMEDLLDEFTIEANQAKSKAESSTSKGQVKRKFSFFGLYKSFGSNPNPRWLEFETKVQEIKGSLRAIVTEKACLSLRENVVDRSNYTYKRDPSTSLLEPQFFGREKEEAQILEILIREVENYDATLSIVPIVGMGGVGKTALAQRLYNDARVNRCFERRAWVCVSNVFDILDITKTILQSITGLSYEGEDLNVLQVKLKDNLSGKKFLVVLDDIWNEKYEKWTALLKPFEAGGKGSKIIVTTRNSTVVSITGASPYPLEVLSLDNCISLLAFHALGATNFESHPDFQTIGKKIAERCKGLPLAAKMLGGALRNKRNPDDWEDTLNNIIWDLPTAQNDEILPVLKLSYVYLPSYLKRCFNYCAVFPKDYEIERDELVLIWIAEGFIDGRNAKENILRSGRNHFDELVSRSFLQQSSVDASKFSMHDLLNDLAKSIAGGTCFSSGEPQQASNKHDASSLEKTRYASFVSPLYITSKCLRAYHRMKALRSLILVHVGSSGGLFYISNKMLHDLLVELKYLRVLSICHCSIVEVPNCVGDLKHLQNLNLSYTRIERLPESIVGLCKLQALILRSCHNLSKLPQGITKLVSLQFLDIRDTRSLKEMPLGIGNLKNLTILSKFVVGLDKGSKLEELKNLPHLQGELFISELQKMEKVRDAIDANLFQKQGLTNLSLHWGEHLGNLRNHECEMQMLNSLRPHTNLENLTISFCGGSTFPSWLDGPSYSKLVSLRLRYCPNVISLPSLGQLPSLKELSLEGLHVVCKIDSEFYGSKRPFSSLTTLKFEGMLAWKDWSRYAGGREEEVPFSCLQHLVVRRCPSFVGTLPCQLDRLIKLEIHSCPHLNNSPSEAHLPSLCELYLEDCNEEILNSFVSLTSLTILRVQNLAELVCFNPGFISSMVKLKELHIRSCDKLTYLWQDGNEMRKLTCLQSVVIENCPRFTSFVAGEGEIELLCNLEMMELTNCTSLERFPSKMHTLRHLSISNCPKIMGLTIPPDDHDNNNTMSQLEYLEINNQDFRISFPFAEGRLAALRELYIWKYEGLVSLEEIIAIESLKSLRITYCKNLGSLPLCLHTLTHLTHLKISDCPALEIEDFPPLPLTLTLSSLSLYNCPKIKSIASCNIASCINLTKLKISGCPELEVEDFPPLPTSLSTLVLEWCPKIKSLPNEWHRLTSLRFLRITYCENIKSFPKGDLPPNLRSFQLWGCENLKQPVREWGLHLLTSLETLGIDGRGMGGEGEKVRFPSEEENEEEDAWSLLFPSSLTSLDIGYMKNVERLSSGLRNRLSSLRWLEISNCPKLRYLPEDGLPPSLQRLEIHECEILKDRCSNLGGDYWPLIQDIPRIHVHGDRIR
ncbi:putative disease resistance protein At3g14460 isoform X1 [Syzygium oleosum]|uniref:putative disease resistance protein At3g14460 isoform X1 n=1 Tax=Syzygium oleosum TaxID=219896 RepID=UPI0024BA9583|nr:putative disease resistance protein At3g14460 isoform X1 [Syzygium oleosum]XP_056175095.1 putative disease resistance protein At3g14460 isoform X1 [Syzygium oleosum]XP_056175096.1 putative disease resistance protein At3g14460 isoform X1 [Syzygium oleosum]XP_056175097.1 putative disease resistance protein At3g14460 isoform X1 [Syzygium oleosum]XP_056175098.1 putative disease resistance protein At3g14460 isoform X1 [Syzygium oleosum]XP_056175099.1 putative disease resistance protein At3g14460